MILVLPIPPALNNMYVNINGRGRARSAAYNSWMDEADVCVLQQRKAIKKVTGPYEVSIKLPRSMRGDIDGRGKAVLDYLVKRAVTPDDEYCERIVLERSSEVEDSFCHVTVEDFAGVAA